jgi:thioredoxin-like negative regulator of GroEL
MQDAEAETPKPIHVGSAADLDDVVDEHGRVLVQFYTDGCGICDAMEPVLGVVAEQTGVQVVLVNPRDDPVLIEEFDVRSVPTLVAFEGGDPVARLADGFVGADEIVALLD